MLEVFEVVSSTVLPQDIAETRHHWQADQLAQQREVWELQRMKADRMADAIAQERCDH
jgi:hypothetical protein